MTESREDLEARIAAYIDGQLPPAEAARLEVFLANTDPRLAEQIIGMLEDRHRLRTLPRPEAPVDLAARVMEQVERATLLNDVEHFSHPARPWWQSRAVVAAGFILVLGGFSWLVVLSIIGPANTQPGKWGGSTAVVNPKPMGPIATVSPAEERAKNGPSSLRTASPSGGGPASTLARGALPSRNELSPPASANKMVDAMTDKEKKSAALASAAPVSPPVATFAAPEKPSAASPDQDDHRSTGAAAGVQNGAQNVIANGLPTSVIHGLAKGSGDDSAAIYTVVNSSVQALKNVAADESAAASQPVVVTLAARDPQDFERLQVTLLAMLSQESAGKYPSLPQAQTGNNLAMNGNNFGAVGGMANNDQQRELNNLNQTKAIPTPAAKYAAVAKDTGYNYFDAKRQQFQYVPPPQSSAQNSKDLQVAAAPAAAPSAPGNAVKGSGQTVENQAAVAKNTQQQQLGGTLHQYDSLQTGLTSMYRVALRPEQIHQLASQFNVVSIRSGGRAYLIRPETTEQVAAVGKHLAPAGDDLDGNRPKFLRDAAAADQAKGEAPAPPATTSPSGATLGAAASAPATAAPPLADVGGKPQDAAAATLGPVPDAAQKNIPEKTVANSPAPQHAIASRKDAGATQYIITMEPPPTPSNGGEHAPSH